MINFNIAAWRAWAPGLDSVADWRAWSQQPRTLAVSDSAPDVSFLPAMQRRRLSSNPPSSYLRKKMPYPEKVP